MEQVVEYRLCQYLQENGQCNFSPYTGFIPSGVVNITGESLDNVPITCSNMCRPLTKLVNPLIINNDVITAKKELITLRQAYDCNCYSFDFPKGIIPFKLLNSPHFPFEKLSKGVKLVDMHNMGDLNQFNYWLMQKLSSDFQFRYKRSVACLTKSPVSYMEDQLRRMSFAGEIGNIFVVVRKVNSTIEGQKFVLPRFEFSYFFGADLFNQRRVMLGTCINEVTLFCQNILGRSEMRSRFRELKGKLGKDLLEKLLDECAFPWFLSQSEAQLRSSSD